MTDCRAREGDMGEVFRADTKGEEFKVVIGGWECRGGKQKSEARWFSLTILPSDAPWLFDKGHSSKTIAAGELLATLACIQLFCEGGPNRAGPMGLSGKTDNLGNSFVLAKMLTTTYPLALVLMQVSVLLSEKKLWLGLQWIPRERNTEADALTNDDFSGFAEHLRISVRFAELRLEVVEKFAVHYRDMMLQRERRKLEAPRIRIHPPKFKRKPKKTLTVW